MNKKTFVYLRRITCLAVFLSLNYGAYAQAGQEEITLQDLSAFNDPGESWTIVGGVTASLEEDNQFETTAGSGVLVNDPEDGEGKDIFTNFEHGDIDLELDYMMAKGSNSGLYLQGRYEIQLSDSWTVKVPTAADNGGIYKRWEESRPEGEKGYQGYTPRQNASRAPGVWQHLEISFQAPRFNADGNKIENAKIISARLNGVTIHEDVELFGPTRGAIGTDEVAQGPLRIQGDHGAVAFQNIDITRYDQPTPTVSGLKYSIYEGAFFEKPDLDTLTVVKSGESELLTVNLGLLPDEFLLQYSGVLNSKEAGDYRFHLHVAGGGILEVDGEEIISIYEDEGRVNLPKGDVPFQVLYARRAGWADPNLEFSVSGEGLRSHTFSNTRSSGEGTNPIYVKAADKPLLRSFRDLPGGSRITHAVSVSSQDKVHYAYDLKHGNLVQLWRGGFLNATPLWYSRGDGSSRPHGSVQNLLQKPAYAINRLDSREAPWMREAGAAQYRSHGYVLDINDNPTFKYEIYGTAVQDKIRGTGEGKGVERTLHFKDAPEDLYMRLAVGNSIQKIAENRFLVDDQSYYLQVSDSGDSEPFIRTSADQQELLLPVHSTVNYTILF